MYVYLILCLICPAFTDIPYFIVRQYIANNEDGNCVHMYVHLYSCLFYFV